MVGSGWLRGCLVGSVGAGGVGLGVPPWGIRNIGYRGVCGWESLVGDCSRESKLRGKGILFSSI